MTKILIPFLNGKIDLWLIFHGMQVAERTQGQIYFLDIVPKENIKVGVSTYQGKIKKMLNKKVKEVRSVYCKSSGNFKEEIVNFVKQKSIDIVILSFTNEDNTEVVKIAKELRYKYGCELEIVKKYERRE
ncbi:hypothetical protein SAMN04488516_10343 [Desulfonauticus submarinus]|uniref:Universal stress protein family protein n=1 Tax=Desulfonauticus submarinus TaxID=206665 RepID=A0A1H0CGN1_9BACT|nr:hypothetical protein [Desulfonauticus submarinus]SDN57040.1 hypothetical protein SAMN04488516_10343 [Desulfonauticus submarinus]